MEWRQWNDPNLMSESHFIESMRHLKVAFEQVPWAIYSTQILNAGQQSPLSFFQDVGPRMKWNDGEHQRNPIIWTDMYIPGMLPEPQVFLVQSIKIFGIASSMALAVFRFVIGNKIYAERPAWLTSVRPGFQVVPNLFIGRMMNFRGELLWEGPAELGRGLTGKLVYQRPVQVVLIGQLLRPVQ